MKEEVYYYLKSRENEPVISVCLIKEADCFFRGVAICSVFDQPNKKIGRTIAKGRALKLKKKMGEPNFMLTMEPDIIGFRAVCNLNFYGYNRRDGVNNLPFAQKASFLAADDLTEFEKELVKKAFKNN